MKLVILSSYALILLLLTSCYRPEQPIKSTGWDYNNPKNGGFQKVPFYEQETPPGMALIHGESFLLKNEDEDSVYTTSKSFYISKYEETNGQYLVYLSFLKRFYSSTTYLQAFPDTTLWISEPLTDSLKEYLVRNYLRGEAFKEYPVVGLSPEQIDRYAEWKTDRVNESILVRKEVIELNTWARDSSEIFTTQSYFFGTYDPYEPINIPDLNPRHLGERRVRLEDDILMPRHRVPTPEEWKLAALAIGDENNKYVKTPKEGRMYKSERLNFSYLFPKYKKAKMRKSETKVQEEFIGLGPVYLHSTNNYSIYGLASGVSEITKDSLGSYVLGGSWKSVIDYSAVYCDTIMEGVKYLFPYDFKKQIHDLKVPSAAMGFRLAMDRIGSPELEYKRGKIKK